MSHKINGAGLFKTVGINICRTTLSKFSSCILIFFCMNIGKMRVSRFLWVGKIN